MEESKRYSIVRVDINCPKDVCGEEDFCFLSKGKTLEDMCNYCDFLQEKRIIGDTKEQLIKKVATAIFRREVKAYKKYWDIEPSRVVSADVYAQCLKVVKEIVEFLGVEE